MAGEAWRLKPLIFEFPIQDAQRQLSARILLLEACLCLEGSLAASWAVWCCCRAQLGAFGSSAHQAPGSPGSTRKRRDVQLVTTH